MQDGKFAAVAELVRCFSRSLDSVLQGPSEDSSQAMIAAISAQCQDKALGGSCCLAGLPDRDHRHGLLLSRSHGRR